jgi:hypothetical protein
MGAAVAFVAQQLHNDKINETTSIPIRYPVGSQGNLSKKIKMNTSRPPPEQKIPGSNPARV